MRVATPQPFKAAAHFLMLAPEGPCRPPLSCSHTMGGPRPLAFFGSVSSPVPVVAGDSFRRKAGSEGGGRVGIETFCCACASPGPASRAAPMRVNATAVTIEMRIMVHSRCAGRVARMRYRLGLPEVIDAGAGRLLKWPALKAQHADFRPGDKMVCWAWPVRHGRPLFRGIGRAERIFLRAIPSRSRSCRR